MIKPAGQALRYLFSRPNMIKGKPDELMKAGEIAFRLMPDTIAAGINVATTQGDVVDKGLAGAADIVLGAGSGLLAGRLGGRNRALSDMLDLGASMGGGMAAYPVGDALIRMKDKATGGLGQTGYEKMSYEQQKLLEQQITQQVLNAYGYLPGTRDMYLNPQMDERGLA